MITPTSLEVEEQRRIVEQMTMEYLTYRNWEHHEETATAFAFWSKTLGNRHLTALQIGDAFIMEMEQ